MNWRNFVFDWAIGMVRFMVGMLYAYWAIHCYTRGWRWWAAWFAASAINAASGSK